MSPKNKTQLARARAERKDQLAVAALASFARSGFSASTTKRLAQEAGVSEGLFYHYFPSKQKLLASIRDRVFTDIRATLARSAAQAERGRRTEGLVRALLGTFRTHQQFWRFALFDRSNAIVKLTLEPDLTKLSRDVRSRLLDAVEQDGFRLPEVETELLFATIEGISERFIRDPANYPFGAVVDHFISTLPRAGKRRGTHRSKGRPRC